MPTKRKNNKPFRPSPSKENQVELLDYSLRLVKYERERIKNAIFCFSQHTSDISKSILLHELNEADQHYSELQSWQSVLMYELAQRAK